MSQEGWSAYSNDSHSNTPNNPNFPSLANIAAFAVAHGKSFAIPEWGLSAGTDDPTYVDGIASLVKSTETSFQSYFDRG